MKFLKIFENIREISWNIKMDKKFFSFQKNWIQRGRLKYAQRLIHVIV